MQRSLFMSHQKLSFFHIVYQYRGLLGFNSIKRILSLRVEEFATPNMPICRKDCFRLIIFKTSNLEEALKTEKTLFSKKHLQLLGKSLFVRVSPCIYQEEKEDS